MSGVCPALLGRKIQQEGILSEDKKKSRRDSVSMVRPYARIRIIVAVVVFLFAFAAIGFRSLFG